MPEDKLSIESLMAAALKGDQHAYSEVLQAITRLIKPTIFRKISDAALADDLIQEVLIAVHKARHTYDPSRPLLPWVMAITRFKVTDALRQHYSQQQHRTVGLEMVAEIAAADVTETYGFSETIRKKLTLLNEKQQKILHLMYVEGYTAKETAEKLNMGESAVKVAAHRAYKVLKQHLGEL
jgi:RNA polymerase sigma-70 factor (ECF subfamily)